MRLNYELPPIDAWLLVRDLAMQLDPGRGVGLTIQLQAMALVRHVGFARAALAIQLQAVALVQRAGLAARVLGRGRFEQDQRR
ncbi:MAG TPA: hypothetical protein VGL99_25580 [Chloroflexota bacterium]